MTGKKEKTLMVRMTEEEHIRLANYAKAKDVSMAKVLRDYVKRLPILGNSDNNGQE
jgi:predicted HicB family RNase H-like nuclease